MSKLNDLIVILGKKGKYNMSNWIELEKNVKKIAQLKWNCTANPETINGVNFDCVLKPDSDRWIIIEVTENQTLFKVRTDIAKHAACKFALISKGIHITNYIVLKEEPTLSMHMTGKENHVKVLSYKTFSNEFIDFQSYSHIRSQKIFGSSVNPFSGRVDEMKYTPVNYEYISQKRKVLLKGITKQLLNNKNIVLLGNYGTGKSRCIRELFQQLAKSNLENDKFIYPIAINLKDNWGAKRAEEIIRRHFDDLGLSNLSDSIIKLLDSENLVFLLDGFDEIGAQTWSDDSSKLQQIRSESLNGIKDLVKKTNGSVIITGREHYFNSETEMLNALGVSNQSNPPLLIKCRDEFTEGEMQTYLSSLSKYINLPSWLPRRPLICQIINELDPHIIEKLFIDTSSSLEFWKTLMTNICDRESRIKAPLDSQTIFKIFIQIAEITRNKTNDLGPLSLAEINSAFEKVVGTPPVDESAIMLQRLPALGRISSESRDRQFIDYYILDGLRAQNLVDYIETFDYSICDSIWKNPLGSLGLDLVSHRISEKNAASTCLQFLKDSIDKPNKIIPGDIIASLIVFAKHKILDVGGLTVKSTHISLINLSKSLLDNFTIEDSVIDKIDVCNSSSSKITIKNCLINTVHGISSEKELPEYMIGNEIEKYDGNPIYTQDPFELNAAQMVFISIIKKIYLSSSKGKKETELINTSGENKYLTIKMLGLLMKKRIIGKSLEGSDNVYKWKAFHEQRILKILKDLANSNDKLWKQISEVK
jgi:hypothetical protein